MLFTMMEKKWHHLCVLGVFFPLLSCWEPQPRRFQARRPPHPPPPRRALPVAALQPQGCCEEETPAAARFGFWPELSSCLVVSAVGIVSRPLLLPVPSRNKTRTNTVKKLACLSTRLLSRVDVRRARGRGAAGAGNVSPTPGPGAGGAAAEGSGGGGGGGG